MAYGYIGSMKTKPGHRDDVVSILLRGVDSLRDVGCALYVVSASDADEDTIWVTKVWQTKERHDASLQLPETNAAIGNAMPRASSLAKSVRRWWLGTVVLLQRAARPAAGSMSGLSVRIRASTN